jgi:hypothetical protein
MVPCTEAGVHKADGPYMIDATKKYIRDLEEEPSIAKGCSRLKKP